MAHHPRQFWDADLKKLRLPYCCIYTMNGEKAFPTKIGITVHGSGRLIQVQSSHWEQIRISGIWLVETVKMATELERKIHLNLSGQHVRGEWFKIPYYEAQQVLQQSAYELRIDLHSRFPLSSDYELAATRPRRKPVSRVPKDDETDFMGPMAPQTYGFT